MLKIFLGVIDTYILRTIVAWAQELPGYECGRPHCYATLQIWELDGGQN
jgi:hypothetical protein